jgi:hypothetical protein
LQFYFWLTDTTIPLYGTNIVQTPDVSGVRSIVHFILFLICLYFGFIRKPKQMKAALPEMECREGRGNPS